MSARIYDTPFAALLPSSIASDPTIHAAAASLDGVLRSLTLSIPNLLLYSRLQATAGREPVFNMLPALERITKASGSLAPLSTAELELLAWQFHVDFREVARTDSELAGMVLHSIPWHRIKGTPAAVRQALGLFGYRAEIEEHNLGMHWATYQLGLPEIADTTTVCHIHSIVREMAPVRCRLWRIYTDIFDRRPIVLANGPKLGEGWLSYYSGVSVPGLPDEDGDIIVSFGVRNGYQSHPYLANALAASFGTHTHIGFLAPYLDTFMVGRSALSDVFPRNNPFVIGSLFSILWADRARVGRSWRGQWDARSWLDYTGFDRQLPRWRMERRAMSRAQLVPGFGEPLSDNNARLGATFAEIFNNPARIGSFKLSAHDMERHSVRVHELFVQQQGALAPCRIPDPSGQGHIAQCGVGACSAALAPYLDRFKLGRSQLGDRTLRNNPFVAEHVFGSLLAERPTVQRTWQGGWGATRWREYTGADRALPPLCMANRALAKSQLVPGWGEGLSDTNARLGLTLAMRVDTPGRVGAYRLSDHDCGRKVAKLTEMRVERFATSTAGLYESDNAEYYAHIYITNTIQEK